MNGSVKALAASLVVAATIVPVAYAGQSTLNVPVTVKAALTTVATPSAPTVACDLAPGSVVTAITTTGGNGKPVTLSMTGDTTDFALSGTAPPANVVVVTAGITSGDCGKVETVSVSASQ